MTQFVFSPPAWEMLIKDPEDRTPAVQAAAEQLGGRHLSFYYCFGEYDGVSLFEAPDDVTAAAVAMAVAAVGHVQVMKTTKLLTATEASEARRKAAAFAYPPPARAGGRAGG